MEDVQQSHAKNTAASREARVKYGFPNKQKIKMRQGKTLM
jgi:hypothetical protein